MPVRGKLRCEVSRLRAVEFMGGELWLGMEWVDDEVTKVEG